MGGVSGAFLLLPFQMSFLGYTNPSVSATKPLLNVMAIPSGIYRYFKEGIRVWPLTWAVIIGTVPGVFIVAIIQIGYLPDPKNFKLFEAIVLLYIGVRMVRDVVQKPPPGTAKASSEKHFHELIRDHNRKAEKFIDKSDEPLPAVKIIHFNLWRVKYEFYGVQFDMPVVAEGRR